MRKNFSGHEMNDKALVDLLMSQRYFKDYNFCMPAPLDEGGKKVGHLLMESNGEGFHFCNCNFVNREPPAGCKLSGIINTAIRESYILDNVDKIYVDNVLISESKTYVDIVYGNIKDGKYNYFDTPKKYEADLPEE